ncbi:MAG: LLM class flavin-dependent oxidoreductase [Actinomycetota bacterium]|nr:LLM class flavin-dependent oxidoreductase [Actinomycetota bacterium]
MADSGRPVEFGFFPVPQAAGYADLVGHVRLAEELGYDLVGVQDHPYQRRYLDTFTLLAWLAAATERIRLFPDVAHLPLRPPAMLAKAAASLDVLSGGRFELGLGAGGFSRASQAMGAPRREGADALAALEEAIGIIRRFWQAPERGIHHDGQHYRLGGVKAGPPPAHDIDIWVGGYGPKMLRLVGRLADGWLPSSGYLSREDLEAKQEVVDAAAEEAGRDPAAIRRALNVGGMVTDGATEQWLTGPVEHWVEELTSLAVESGFDTFVFWPDEDPGAQLRAFAEVAGGVREAVSRARSR